MLIRVKKASDLSEAHVTPKDLYMRRREFMVGAGAAALSATLPFGEAEAAASLKHVKTDHGKGLTLTDKEYATKYNNFYEFALDKDNPAKVAKDFKPLPWTVTVSGACHKPGDYSYEDLVQPHELQERIYRFRCVEAWSMVVPWIGVSLGDMLNRFEPTGDAKYVEFRTLHDPERMPMQKTNALEWPYREGLRMDEATHPLTMMVVGMYGEMLPNQNGAPLRLIIPWKYGFKSIKSIVSIHFTDKMPATTWAMTNAREYGFYANVNPEVDHPRWSQAKERIIGGGLFRSKVITPMLNGYAEEVAHLYQGMDPKTLF
ncbi:protein-methionine-sulfoxide reductase catalytic subunit MsrP [Magnetospira sp. QH-2]|uniref:protein-methionine-sulfoxide reductase catalytic subunit MsrP n=1 Tax=Magnetospira sp. (strain QH-2) TaxID=1288970 RepID=UPI0003E81A15|nr:protein-methionine-sulfoxide reductase catalytic subunit MsrP [Magnetospira sp. QH-2]CCQ72052.1 molybdopterin oxidoreductase yedY [Magnetospira sp. QH-2]